MKNFLIFILLTSFLYSKTLIKEYTYDASENDSKVTARQKALSEVKKLAIEEVGIYIHSELNYTKSLNNDKLKRKIESKIETISSAITKTKILEERWNGEKYYIRVEIVVNDNKINHTIKEIQKTKPKIAKKRDSKLLWEKKTSRNRNFEYNFAEAIGYCKNLNNTKKQNWRLPTKNELIHGYFRQNTLSDLKIYWSSTKTDGLKSPKIILISLDNKEEFYYYPKGYFSVICIRNSENSVKNYNPLN